MRLSLVSSKHALLSASATESADPGAYFPYKSYRCNISINFCTLSGASCKGLRCNEMACGRSQLLLFSIDVLIKFVHSMHSCKGFLFCLCIPLLGWREGS